MIKYLPFLLILSLLTGCRGCSKIRHRNSAINQELTKNRTNRRSIQNSENSVIKMREESGVYYVPLEINGVNMEFIFDTGASSISISQTEALFLLKQGKLKEEDFLGNVEFTDANGDISEGTIINLREVKIGNTVEFNVEASVVHNQRAPLLFGQSAMNRFGKITIDYDNNEITFN
jgi:aspartyl protease family protein